MSGKNPGHAKINGATVYYLYEAPPTQDLKHELQVLQTFVTKWNANTPDTRKPAWLPRDTKAPPPLKVLLVTANNHLSTSASSAGQPEHISAYVIDEAGWALNPHECGAKVHVFAKNQDPAQGYKDYWMYSKSRQKLGSPAFLAALAAAEAHDFGTLGQGDLA
ncbi:hypothetical protein BV20DRAFT_1053394 [Pilatotrama ljubarskyi]|nr:hypothetical protein BV20DRAFT_1053394 [Pilatotrama ljubarskyi]